MCFSKLWLKFGEACAAREEGRNGEDAGAAAGHRERVADGAGRWKVGVARGECTPPQDPRSSVHSGALAAHAASSFEGYNRES